MSLTIDRRMELLHDNVAGKLTFDDLKLGNMGTKSSKEHLLANVHIGVRRFRADVRREILDAGDIVFWPKDFLAQPFEVQPFVARAF